MTEEEDFGEANFVDRLKQDWKKTPIITKTFFQVCIAFYSNRRRVRRDLEGFHHKALVPVSIFVSTLCPPEPT